MRILKKMSGLSAVLMAVWVTVSGCSQAAAGEPLVLTGFAFDTTYTLTLYRGGSQELLDSCIAQCSRYEEIFSRTREDSELFQINEIERLYEQTWQEETGNNKIAKVWDRLRGKKQPSGRIARLKAALGKKLQEQGIEGKRYEIFEDGSIRITVSKELAELVKKGLEYSRLSQGGFDITIYPVSKLWDFTSGESRIPDRAVVKRAVEYVDYTKVTVDGETVTFAMPGMGIDLGGIAKGYIADGLKAYLKEGGVSSGMVNLGGNVLCIGRKSQREPFHIGIQQPFADRNETIAAISAEDVSIVSSGIYERYIQDGDRLYHHILNPRTGYSYENGLIGVTIVSEKSVDGDGVSTAAFALGLEKGMELIESMEDVEAVFITEDETLHETDGFREMIYERQ